MLEQDNSFTYTLVAVSILIIGMIIWLFSGAKK